MIEPIPAKDSGNAARDEILRAVAEHLGATKDRIYHHYHSKADLFFDVQVAAMALRHAQILLTELPMQKVAV